jgi:hypothetical protein
MCYVCNGFFATQPWYDGCRGVCVCARCPRCPWCVRGIARGTRMHKFSQHSRGVKVSVVCVCVRAVCEVSSALSVVSAAFARGTRIY